MNRLAVFLAILIPTVCLAQEQPATLTPEQAMRLIQNLQPGERREVVITEENAVGVGPGLTAENGDVDISKFDTSAPTATLGKGKAGSTGGSLSASLSVLGKELNIFAIGAVLCLLAAGVAAYFRLFGAAIAAAGLAGVLIFAAAQPELAGIAIVLGVCGVAAYFVWQGKKGKEFHEAARAVIGGVALSPPEAQAVVKAEIAKQADDADKAVIKRIKRKDDLP